MHHMTDAPELEPNYAAEHRSRDPAVALAALARSQYGVVSRRQIVELGLGRHQIARLLQRGRLHVLHRGVYAVGHRALTHDGRWMAAVLAAGPDAVLSHRTAAALWGIRESSSSQIEITAPRERRRPGVLIHSAALPADERDVHQGIPVTTPARTLLDLAAILGEHQLARACERAEALRLGSPTSLRDLVDRYPRRPGTPALRRLLDAGSIVDTDTRSGIERRLLSLLDAESLPRPLVNAPLELPGLSIKPDFMWREQRLIVETDGFETHGTRDAFERDRARDRALQTAGWRVIRVTRRQLESETKQIAAALRALLRPPRERGSRAPGAALRRGRPSRR
jgi:predicted transcriptional regulator of viral defense system